MPATAPGGVNLVGSLGTGDGAGQVVRQLSRALDVALTVILMGGATFAIEPCSSGVKPRETQPGQ